MRVRASFLGLLVLALLPACVDVAFSDGAGGASSSSTTAIGGASGVGGASVTSSTTTTSVGGSGVGSGGGGGAPCVPSTESCNGLDDDCDGLTDQPPSQVAGPFCGCDWIFDASMGGRAYALCSSGNESFDEVPCPGGTVKAVLQTSTEQTFLTAWIDPILGVNDFAFIGLRQAPSSPTSGAGWGWIVGPSDPPGMVPPFGTINDYEDFEPAYVEDGDQDCGALGNDSGAAPTLQDTECDDGATHVLCEQASPQPCANGGSCLRDEGCAGVFDCTLPAGSQCVATPVTEECNGRDDDCDGSVDATGLVHACGCVPHTNPANQRKYKVCSTSRVYAQAQCGPGYKLVIIGDGTEQAYVQSLLGGGDYLIGLFQLTDAVALGGKWFWPNGTALGTTLWEPLEPNDGDGIENALRNCAHTVDANWHDAPCGTSHPYVCEEI